VDDSKTADNLRYFRPRAEGERPALRRITLAELTHVAELVVDGGVRSTVFSPPDSLCEPDDRAPAD
jgi:hypothetical protein